MRQPGPAAAYSSVWRREMLFGSQVRQGRFLLLARGSIVGVIAALAVAWAAHAAPPGAKGPLKDWPCPEPRVDALAAEALYAKPLPAALPAPSAWQSDPEVKPVVEFAAAPENNPNLGAQRIAELASAAGPRKQEALMMALSGIVERTNALRGIIIDGIGDKVVKSRLLFEQVAANDRDLAAVPNDGTSAAAERRSALETARYWNNRYLGDAADDAELLCHRLAYTAKKAQALAGAIRTELERP